MIEYRYLSFPFHLLAQTFKSQTHSHQHEAVHTNHLTFCSRFSLFFAERHSLRYLIIFFFFSESDFTADSSQETSRKVQTVSHFFGLKGQQILRLSYVISFSTQTQDSQLHYTFNRDSTKYTFPSSNSFDLIKDV